MDKVLFKYEGDEEFKPFSSPCISLVIYDRLEDNLEFVIHNKKINKKMEQEDIEKVKDIIKSNRELFNIKYYNVMGEYVTVKLLFEDKEVEIRDFLEYKKGLKMKELLKVLDSIKEILEKYDININWGEI